MNVCSNRITINKFLFIYKVHNWIKYVLGVMGIGPNRLFQHIGARLE